MKCKYLLSFILLSLLLTGCTKDPSPTFDYQLDGKTEQLHPNEKVEQLCYEEDQLTYFYQLNYEKEYDEFSINFDSEKEIGKALSIYGITINDDINEVIQKADIKKDLASFNYEYDPYQDGCTEVNTGIFDGTIIDFEENHILDYVLQQRYDLVDNKWIIHNYHDNSSEQTYVIVNYTFSGSTTHYSKEQGKLMALSIAYMQEK